MIPISSSVSQDTTTIPQVTLPETTVPETTVAVTTKSEAERLSKNPYSKAGLNWF